MIYVIQFKNNTYLTYKDTPIKAYTRTNNINKATKFTNKDRAISIIQFYNLPARIKVYD